MVGIVTKEAPTPEHPEFPILLIRQRPDNIRWKEGTAATNDISQLTASAVELIDAIRRGDADEHVTVRTYSGEEIELDVSTVVSRYKGAK